MDHGILHIVMFPWLALGHILPFLELSKRIAQLGHRVSFLSTPRNIQKLPKLPPNLAPLINFVEFPLPQVDGLPETMETTIELPSDELRPYLRKAYDSLDILLSKFLQDSPSPSPDWILYDYAAYWVPSIAAKFGIPSAYLGLFSSAVFGFMGPPSVMLGGEDSRTEPEQFTVCPKWVPFPSTVAYRPFEAREVFQPGVLPDASGVSEMHRFGAAIDGCQVMAVRSCTEFESDWIQLIEKLYRKPVIPFGLLPPSLEEIDNGDESHSRWASAFEWMDKQAPGSVVYVAFGSEVKLSSAQVHEIAVGLELSELPFVWALREGLDVMLPEGFKDRIKGRGIVCVGWVPQVRFLSHSSMGGFLTHCGWNSIIEGLAFGLALVLLPLVFDQGLNARHLGERKIGMEVPRKEEDGSFTGDGIAETLRLVLVEEKGEPFRAKARECKGIFGDREMQDGYVRGFVEWLRDHRKQQASFSVV